MAKAKSHSVPNKALYSRVSYLYQAATYLATQQQQHSKVDLQEPQNDEMTDPELIKDQKMPPNLRPASRRLVSELRDVSLKMQLRMSPAMKHSICKKCSTLLLDGSTCSTEMENKSKDGKKPWADVLVRKCTVCGLAKRFPVAAKRQKRRPYREIKVDNQEIDPSGG